MTCPNLSYLIRQCSLCSSLPWITFAQQQFVKGLLKCEIQGSRSTPTVLRRMSSSSSTHKLNEAKSNLNYCIQLVRQCDHENYLSILLLPKSLQRAAFALRAFNVELAQIRGSVSDKTIGLMKLKFWTDAIDNIYQSRPPQAPVPMELAGACGYYSLSKRWLDRAVNARTVQIQTESFLTIESVEDHAEQVNSSLNYLMLECLDIKNVQADHAASHLGKAQGLVTLVRATPYHAQGRRVYLPMEILAKHKVSQEDIIRGKDSQSVKDVIFDLAGLAHQHLEKARSLRSSVPEKTYLVFLNAAVCDLYLKALQRADFNVFDGRLQHKYHLLPYHMFMNKLKKKY